MKKENFHFQVEFIEKMLQQYNQLKKYYSEIATNMQIFFIENVYISASLKDMAVICIFMCRAIFWYWWL